MIRCKANNKMLKSFSLVEVIVVLSILAVLISFLLPAIGSLRNSAYEVQCTANYRQIYNVMQIYAQDNEGYLPRQNLYDYYGVKGKKSNNTAGWHGHLAPYLYEEKNNNWNQNPEINSEFMNKIINYIYPDSSKKWQTEFVWPEEGWGHLNFLSAPKLRFIIGSAVLIYLDYLFHIWASLVL